MWLQVAGLGCLIAANLLARWYVAYRRRQTLELLQDIRRIIANGTQEGAMRIECQNPEAVARRAFYLAWQACRGPLGMGVFQDRGDATEADVWANITGSPHGGDYPSMKGVYVADPNRPGKARADYVFGRMMKLGLEWDDTSVSFSDSPPRADYQAWCVRYPTTEQLVRAAIESCHDNQ